MNNDQAIYRQKAAQYERMVAREDYQGNLLPAISGILPLAGLNVLELGAGTGRVTHLLAPHARSILALDNSLPMLEVAQQSLNCTENHNAWLAVADHRHLPVINGMADLVISGWSLCYLVSPGAAEPYPDWQESLETVLQEMQRALQSNGMIVLIETMGTGFDTPHPPSHLDIYYQWLIDKGFSSTWTRTDYQFASLAEAVELTRFFFGEKLAQEVTDKNWVILPECTGVWWKKNSD